MKALKREATVEAIEKSLGLLAAADRLGNGGGIASKS